MSKKCQKMSKNVKLLLTNRMGNFRPVSTTDYGGGMQKILSMIEVAELFDCTRQTVHNRLKLGTFPVDPIADSKPPKWFESDIERYFQQNEKA